eukprot:7994806-Pyramimonas_sp.AAC.1
MGPPDCCLRCELAAACAPGAVSPSASPTPRTFGHAYKQGGRLMGGSGGCRKGALWGPYRGPLGPQRGLLGP